MKNSFLQSVCLLVGIYFCSASVQALEFYAGNFHIGTPHYKLGLDTEHVQAAGFTDAVEGWVPQGEDIRLTPVLSGDVYLTKLGEAQMGLEEIRSMAAKSVVGLVGQSISIGTADLESGTYFLSLVQNGAVVAALRIHLAFTQIPISPDYGVFVERSDDKLKPLPTYHSFRLPSYMRYNNDLKGELITQWGPVEAHSWANLSADDYPVTVRLKVKPGARGLSLPLTSAKVLPSSYGISCRIENGDTIVFTLDRPEKVIVIPNHEKAWAVYEQIADGHEPVLNWQGDLIKEMQRDSFKAQNPLRWLSEGYVNPFVFLGRTSDPFMPDPEARKTLIVYPGEQPSQEDLDEAQTVWFKPGPHDFSRLGDWTVFHTKMRSGQTFYLEEGAWLLARIAKASTSDRDGAHLVGRGTVSGIHHFWGGGGFPAGSQIIEVDEIRGVNFVDRAFFGIEGGDLIEDIAMLGSWHWNNDGVDSMDNCTIRDSLLMAHDDNLKLDHNTHAEHLVLYMLGTNGHAIMVKEILTGKVFSHSVVKDIDIVGYWKNPLRSDSGWNALTPGAIAFVTGSDLYINNFTFSDIRIESPFLYRVFSIYNMDTNKDYAAPWFWYPTDENVHTRIDGLRFDNITVNSPLIAARSILGSAYAHSLKDISFNNLVINGVPVTEDNKDEHFEIDDKMVENLKFSTAD